jgi:holo-[acyl-carrier protein] synthase
VSVLGLGLDVVDLTRLAAVLERHGERFEARICRPGEAREALSAERRLHHLGGLFAAKEAVLKALGTGWSQGMGFRQVTVGRDEAGRPTVTLHGAARERASELGVRVVHLSITHDGRTAAAVAVLEGGATGERAPGLE